MTLNSKTARFTCVFSLVAMACSPAWGDMVDPSRFASMADPFSAPFTSSLEPGGAGESAMAGDTAENSTENSAKNSAENPAAAKTAEVSESSQPPASSSEDAAASEHKAVSATAEPAAEVEKSTVAAIAPAAAAVHSTHADTSVSATGNPESGRAADLPPLPEIEVKSVQTSLTTLDLTATPDSLLERVRKGFAMPNLDNDLVLHHQMWYQNHPDYLRRMLERSRRYLHYIVEEVEKRGMPTELALLPMIESSFDPMAYSRSHASGLWQFIPSTGKNYNLRQDAWIDERRDIVASTAAALDYLSTIYQMHGDWFLALASYNWGEGAVARAMKKNEGKGLPTDYANLTLPAETRNYVPRLQALKNIFSNSKLLAELNLPQVPNRPYFTTVAKPADEIDIKVAARLAEIPVDEFVALNPAHNRPVIRAEAPLVLPADKAEVFAANLESHRNADKPLSSWYFYTIKSGERLDKLASRFKISTAELKRVNGIGKREHVGAGYTLLIPAGKGVAVEDLELALSLGSRTAGLQAESRAEGKSRMESELPAEPILFSHRVKPGETLFSVARKYGVSVAELKKQNKLKGDRLSTGARLTVLSANVKPVADASESSRRASLVKADVTAAKVEKSGKRVAKAAAEKTTGKAARNTRYTIRRGDTLASIARRFNVEEDDLQRWNKVVPTRLQPGQTLTIGQAQSES